MKTFYKLILLAFCLVLALPTGLIEAFAQTPDLNIQSQAYVVMDAATGQVLIQNNMHRQMAPASITKILTSALALEQKTDLTKMVTMSREAVYSIPVNSTHIALEEGESASLEAMLHGTMLISANDAANGVALGVTGDLETFVALMNQKTAELELTNTRWANAHGLDHSKHYTSAYDMGQITRWAITVPGFRELFGTTEYNFPTTNRKARNYTFFNQNAMLHSVNSEYYTGVQGGKLGYTDNAGHTIVTVAKRGNMELICVAMNSKGRNPKYNDTKKLLDYCFENFRPLTLYSRELEKFIVPIGSRTNPELEASIYQTENLSLLVPVGITESILTYRYNIPELYYQEDDVSPSISIFWGDKELHTFPLAVEITPTGTISGITSSIASLGFATDPGQRLLRLLILILKCLGVALCIAIVALFIVRALIQIYYHRKRKHRISARRAALAENRSMHLSTTRNSSHLRNNVTHIHPKQQRPAIVLTKEQNS